MDFANFFFNFFAKKIALPIAQFKDFHILEAIYSVPSPVRARAEDIRQKTKKGVPLGTPSLSWLLSYIAIAV